MTYKKYCPNCKKETIQEISKVSIRKGCKTICLCCGELSLRYSKIKYLEKYKIK